MIIGLLLVALSIAFIIELIRKYILRVEEDDIHELWQALEKEAWFQVLLTDEHVKPHIVNMKDNGILTNPEYVKKLLEHEGTREGFIAYIQSKRR
ncbi:hypothetical protein [Caldalkalibacillus salinus]|uniref:hypothetical protein n=1 Tax=Caldalkalibacillus salinus TaxID=2803787 RepID=UPI0019228115|nr:hypothetical protein [Caldalkalibacillus salinus]